ncbi:MAG TPA: capsular biosynthesis protein, partial [Anaeromyxobacter sp.]
MMPAETLKATIPVPSEQARLVALDKPDSPAAEQYRVLYQRLVRLAARRPVRVVAVTSAGRREGRTTTAANLALTAAQEGRPTVLVEGDLRR